MALITYERTNEIAPALSQVLTESGFVDIAGSPFLGSIVSAIQTALSTEYGKMYDIAKNVDIGRAEGEYLDRWGKFLVEPRESLSYTSDLTLKNTRIFIDPEVTAGELTILGDGITIPSGVSLTDDEDAAIFETIDEIYVRPDRSDAYCRVISAIPGAIDIVAGQLTKTNIIMADFENIIPSAMSEYSFMCENAYNISGGVESAPDEEYRYVLMKKAESIGLFNESKIQSAMDVTEIVGLSVQEYRGGANVFVETKNIQNVDAIVQTVRTGLKQGRSLGLCVNVYAPIAKYLTANVKLELRTDDPTNATQEQFNTDYCSAINTIAMGNSIDLESILSDIVNDTDNVKNARVLSASYGGRTLVRFIIGQYFNEKILASEDRIAIL